MISLNTENRTHDELRESEYDSESTSSAFRSMSPSSMTRGNSPANGSVVVLQYGSGYLSQPFSGSGWIFASHQFRPSPNTGRFLLWETYTDSGVVGDNNQANMTKKYGSMFGSIIYPDQRRYFTGQADITTYYSRNPIRDSRYYVSNKNI